MSNAMACPSRPVARFSLNEWLLEHREQFVTFTVEEIAERALTCGYSQEEVDLWIKKKDRRFH